MHLHLWRASSQSVAQAILIIPKPHRDDDDDDDVKAEK